MNGTVDQTDHDSKTIGKSVLQGASCLRSRRSFKVVCFLTVVFIVYLGYQIYDDGVTHLYLNEGHAAPCEIPELNPYDPEMMKYIWKPEPLTCHKNPTPVVYIDDDNLLQYNISAIRERGLNESSIHCEYSSIIRSSKEYKIDMEIEFSAPKDCVPPIDIHEDFFRVTCKANGKTIFDNTVTKIVKTNRELGKVNPDEDIYNLMLFGIDSVSHASAIRQLPNTVKYLRETLKALEFRGYTKVADNTYPNMIPLLTGFNAYSDEIPKIDFFTEYNDDQPFIWKNFSAQGYATMFAEDLPNLGMFNLEKIGFKEYPSDHYMRPYWLGNFKLTPMHNLVTHVQRILQNNNVRIAPSAICNGNVPNHVTLTNYLKQFMWTYRKEKKFMFSFLTELAHEFQNFLNLGDTDIYEFLKWMKEHGFMEDTIVVMFSDHGMKFGNNQHLFAARLESRLPFLNIVLPEKLTQKYPNLLKNIRTNQNRVASTFDLHATIRDVLHSNFGKPTRFYVKQAVRGVSLFEEFSKDRSCKDANIGDSFCACYKSEPVNVTDNEIVHKMALKSVDHINELLKDSPQCAHLALNSTNSARKISQGLKQKGVLRRKNLPFSFHVPKAEERDDTKYVIDLTTTPGGGRFYATCSYNVASGLSSVIGSIDRINRYGNQSHCTHFPRQRPYCLCNDMVGKDNYRKR